MAHSVSISVDPSSRSFYTVGDVIVGAVVIESKSRMAISDIQIKLRCDEYAVVEYAGESDRRKHRRDGYKRGVLGHLGKAAKKEALQYLGKAGNLDEDTLQIMNQGLRMTRRRTKHKGVAIRLLSLPDNDEKINLSEGRHSFPFEFKLTDEFKEAPPSAPLYNKASLKNGVFWTLKAVVRRPMMSRDMREVVTIPVYPSSTTVDTCGDRESVKWEIGDRTKISISLSLPAAGVPQDDYTLPIQLQLDAESPVFVKGFKLKLQQKSVAKTKGFKEAHEEIIDLGQVRINKTVKGPTDFSQELASMPLPEVLPPTLSLQTLSVSYTLLFDLLMATTTSKKIPIKLLEPSIAADSTLRIEDPKDSGSAASITGTTITGTTITGTTCGTPNHVKTSDVSAELLESSESYFLPEKAAYPEFRPPRMQSVESVDSVPQISNMSISSGNHGAEGREASSESQSDNLPTYSEVTRPNI